MVKEKKYIVKEITPKNFSNLRKIPTHKYKSSANLSR
jgi:hypothetical protein